MKIRSIPSIYRNILAGGIFSLTSIASEAAVVTWGAAQAITGDSDVSLAGTFNGAANFGHSGVAATTVNTVTFNAFGFSLGSNSLGVGVGPFSALTPQYQALLSSSVIGLASFAVSSLTLDQTYQIQFWWNNSSTATAFTTTLSSGNAVLLSSNVNGIVGGLGQFVLGTWVADSTIQSFSFSSTAALNGFQLRAIPAAPVPVPEPGSALAGLLALGVCLSGLGRRNRRQSAEA